MDLRENIVSFFQNFEFFLREYEILRKKVTELEKRVSQYEAQKDKREEADLVSITQIVKEYGLTRPTIYKYKKLGVLKPVVKSPMMFERKNVERLVLAVRG